MKARKLRWVLMVAVLAMIITNISGYMLLSKLLSQKAVATDHALIDADIARTNKEQLQKLQKQLADSSDTVSKARKLVGTQTDYEYQDQVINDLNQLAKTYGIKISSYSFTDPTKQVATTPGASAAKALPRGVKQVPVTISTVGAIGYENYLKFLRALELNLTRLQVTGIDITPTSSTGTITSPSITIQMYVRQ